MNISQLQEKIVRLEKELYQAQKQLSHTHDPTKISIELVKSRAYAFDSKTLSAEEVVKGCADSIDRYGFCLIESIIPTDNVPTIRQEVMEAQLAIARNLQAVSKLIDSRGYDDQELLATENVELRPVRRVGCPPKLPNDIVWMPEFARQLANPLVKATAKQVLDDHLRIGSLHAKIIDVSSADSNSEKISGFDRNGLPRMYSGGKDIRDWHSDWPHDPSAIGGDNPDENLGFIRQPFPDITMSLTMIWYLTSVDEKSGGTWVVPGSHRDKRSPRGPSDGITVTAPIPGEMQIKAKAGSVFIQDSRTWHSSPLHNLSLDKRVAVVNRWHPWWLSVDEYAPGSRYSVYCRTLSHSEYLALPAELQPLMRHLCPDEPDAIQQPLLDRAKAAAQHTIWGHRQVAENLDSLAQANKHIRVPLIQ